MSTKIDRENKRPTGKELKAYKQHCQEKDPHGKSQLGFEEHATRVDS